MTEIRTDIDFTQLVTDVACIKQAILGNGEPGLCQRVDELEKAVKKQTEKQARVCGFCAGFGMIIGGALSWFINWFKGGVR